MSIKIIYLSKWEKHYQWPIPWENDKYNGYCKLCLKTFRIDGSGISQVKSHENSKSHKK